MAPARSARGRFASVRIGERQPTPLQNRERERVGDSAPATRSVTVAVPYSPATKVQNRERKRVGDNAPAARSVTVAVLCPPTTAFRTASVSESDQPKYFAILFHTSFKTDAGRVYINVLPRGKKFCPVANRL